MREISYNAKLNKSRNNFLWNMLMCAFQSSLKFTILYDLGEASIYNTNKMRNVFAMSYAYICLKRCYLLIGNFDDHRIYICTWNRPFLSRSLFVVRYTFDFNQTDKKPLTASGRHHSQPSVYIFVYLCMIYD